VATNTAIQWTDASWNPVVGCKRVSAGCDHCYAFQLHDQRHIAWKRGRFPGAPKQYHVPFSQVQLLPERLSDPLHWRKPRRVFVNSMSDLFHEDVPDEFILDVWATMRIAKQHTFQILTKRPERMRDWVRKWASTPTYDNIWLGVSVENQAAADERIPLLLETPAAVRFLSCEPLLGPLDLNPWLTFQGEYDKAEWHLAHYGASQPLRWVIIGGESGPHARLMHPEWACSLVAQCRAAGVAPFVKQLGSQLAYRFSLKDRHGGNMEEWPPDYPELCVREYPQDEERGGA
jgi:protein gp37